ncbi:ABC transporter permease [Clostridium sp. Cult1]|jgi:simple sugar transport system permease protein|uniref:ABC transporter permease n=1 Tax=Clostridium sp. Cult1 TaxID=2079002 RepID=UPI001F27BFF1|nr:ABC transporter permease [Clostridium sp. Cult1]MCF6462512.1 ABC transporter permease [Clostridium sp. Cult1]
MKQNKFIITIISILLGLIVGGIALLIAGFDPIEAYGIMFKGVFSNPKYISWTIIRSTPLILTGISVAFAFKTGLFNIGAEGQFIIGSLVATLVGYFFHLPPIIHPIVAILAGALAAAIWGGIAGLLKSKFGINEVITTIMLNWTALYFSNFVVFWEPFKRLNRDASERILDTASIQILNQWKTSEAGKAFLKSNSFLKDLLNPPVNFGFIIAILVAVLIWYVLKNTTLGYQLRAVGYNRDAAEYGGININRNIILSMMIAGAISGLAGATQVLGVSKETAILATMEGYGFDGMAVALIASSNPLACIPAALLFGGLKYGGSKLQPTIGAPIEVINITIGVIILFVAMPKLIELITSMKGRKRGVKVEDSK